MRLRTAVVGGAAAVMAISLLATPVAAGPSPPLVPAPVYVQVIGDDDLDQDPKLLDVGVFRYPLDDMTEKFIDALGVISVAPAGGRPQRVGRFAYEQGGGTSEHSVDPCSIGGKDLPDKRFTVTVEFPDVSPPYRYSRDLRLGPDETKPKMKRIQSSPPPGSKVEPGDKIRFEVVGKEDLPGATWQTGVQTLQVTGPRGVIKDKNAGRTPKACGNKSDSLTINDKYKVKGGDPAVIEICGIAQDYAANEDSTCARYYKGEVWEGSYRARAEVVGTGNPCSFTLEGPVQVVVAPDGSLTGSISASFTEVMEDPASPCVAVAPGTGPYPFPISGNRDRNHFNVTVSGPYGSFALELDVAGKKAEGSEQVFYFAITMNLTCKTCDE